MPRAAITERGATPNIPPKVTQRFSFLAAVLLVMSPTHNTAHSARCMPDERTLFVAATRSAPMMSNDCGLRCGPISRSQSIEENSHANASS
jgi:hypothetical protein